MKTTRYIGLVLLSAMMLLTGCRDYLTEIEPGKTMLDDYYTSPDAAIQNVTGCYVPLMWEYGNTYFPEWFIGDVVSDDALKGGGNTSDMADAYDMENWRTTNQNNLLLDFYRANYQGIGRCNLALKYIPDLAFENNDAWTPELKNRLLGEVYFLRAYYYFRLVRVFAGTPLITKVLDNDSEWGQPRASVGAVYAQILADLEQAERLLPVKSSSLYAETDLGRATKGAAQAMLLKTNLYMASPYWQSYGLEKTPAQCYADAKAWGEQIIASGEYDLLPKFGDNFTIAGENGLESVFEIQYAAVTWGDYGNGSHLGFTAGSFTQILVRSRSGQIGAGWGFNHPTQNLYDEFEAGDLRRDEAILTPDEAKMETPAVEYYLGNKYLNNKTGMYRDTLSDGSNGEGGWGNVLDHATRGPLNNRQIRYSDVLLMYAEACLGAGDEATAKQYINKVRARVGLGEVGTYTFRLNGTEVANPTVEQCLRHERRMELAMEGHRWFDLVRWYGANGELKTHMEAYQATEDPLAKRHMQAFVAGKHEIFPIPQTEIQLNPTHMDQNPWY